MGLLERTARIAEEYLATVGERHVGATQGFEDVLTRLDSPLPEQAWAGRALQDYFPAALREVASPDAHPLRREIVVTTLVNDVVDRGGITAVFEITRGTVVVFTDARWQR